MALAVFARDNDIRSASSFTTRLRSCYGCNTLPGFSRAATRAGDSWPWDRDSGLGLLAVFKFGGLERSDKTIRIPVIRSDVIVWGGHCALKRWQPSLIGRLSLQSHFSKGRMIFHEKSKGSRKNTSPCETVRSKQEFCAPELRQSCRGRIWLCPRGFRFSTTSLPNLRRDLSSRRIRPNTYSVIRITTHKRGYGTQFVENLSAHHLA